MVAFQVGITASGSSTRLTGIRVLLMPEDPDNILVRAGYVPAGGSLADKFSADCRNIQNCARDLQLMTAKGLGRRPHGRCGPCTDPEHRRRPLLSLHDCALPEQTADLEPTVNLQAGSNSVKLDQTNGALAQP
jgi:hypothetical protein